MLVYQASASLVLQNRTERIFVTLPFFSIQKGDPMIKPFKLGARPVNDYETFLDRVAELREQGLAVNAIAAELDEEPHSIYSVIQTLTARGVPNPKQLPPKRVQERGRATNGNKTNITRPCSPETGRVKLLRLR